MKQPKFKFFDTLISKKGTIFRPTSIFFDDSANCYAYTAIGVAVIHENNLEIYVEPKPKIKMWLYAYKHFLDGWCIHSNYYIYDATFVARNPQLRDFKKLEWSEIEVSDE